MPVEGYRERPRHRLKLLEDKMPRYYFHVLDGRAFMDPEGIELRDTDHAITEAIRTAGEIIRDGNFVGEEWTMRVVDDDHQLVEELRFSAKGALLS